MVWFDTSSRSVFPQILLSSYQVAINKLCGKELLTLFFKLVSPHPLAKRGHLGGTAPFFVLSDISNYVTNTEPVVFHYASEDQIDYFIINLINVRMGISRGDIFAN